MRYAIFTDIHANLEALEAVLAKIDELAQEEPIEQIWFLGDLVGYGPNPNECIVKLRERTDVIIAGNHDWAAVGKIDLEDFSEAARISAEWTAGQLTDEHRRFLADLPERIERNDFLLVHGSPYGPLWEYLTSEVMAERSFQQFSNRYCLVGHTHVPIIFVQPDTVANAPTRPLEANEALELLESASLEYASNSAESVTPTQKRTARATEDPEKDEDEDNEEDEKDDETRSMLAIRPAKRAANGVEQTLSDHVDHVDTQEIQSFIVDTADAVTELHQQLADDAPEDMLTLTDALPDGTSKVDNSHPADAEGNSLATTGHNKKTAAQETHESDDDERDDDDDDDADAEIVEQITPEETIQGAEERLNQEIEELLTLLGLSQSMIEITNEMILPPDGTWHTPGSHRAIINPGGVGQPRDGDPRAAFMVYDTGSGGFTFYRVPYAVEKTQKKIIEAGLPQYLATRLAYGR